MKAMLKTKNPKQTKNTKPPQLESNRIAYFGNTVSSGKANN